MSNANLQQRLQDLLTSIQQGKIMEAMKEFYDAAMRSNHLVHETLNIRLVAHVGFHRTHSDDLPRPRIAIHRDDLRAGLHTGRCHRLTERSGPSGD